MQYCKNCANVKPNGNKMWYCTKHRTMITAYTLASAVPKCNGRDYTKAPAPKDFKHRHK